MKNKIIIGILTLVFGLAVGWFSHQFYGKVNSTKPSRDKLFEEEDFKPFFWKFMTDSTFQVSRVQFPFKLVQGINGSSEIDSALFEKNNWRHIPFYAADEYKSAIYDNFKGKRHNTNERIFRWEGVENGINVSYFFKRNNGIWMLIRKEDWSN